MPTTAAPALACQPESRGAPCLQFRSGVICSQPEPAGCGFTAEGAAVGSATLPPSVRGLGAGSAQLADALGGPSLPADSGRPVSLVLGHGRRGSDQEARGCRVSRVGGWLTQGLTSCGGRRNPMRTRWRMCRGQKVSPPAAEARFGPGGGLPVPWAETAAAPRNGHCPVCLTPDDHDEWNADARGETPLQRVDRSYGEILQEVRVAQTGVQILFAFLLALAFTARFATVTRFQRDLYVVTLLLCAGAAALLIAPAAIHRVIYRRRLKQHLVRVANRLALSGLVLLLLSMASAVLLILDFVFGTGPAVILAAAVLAWFTMWWFVLPLRTRVRELAEEGAGSGDDRSSALD